MATALPLHGVRVVDFGTFIAGPLVSRLLSDAGADVVRVLPPGKQESPAYCDPGEVLNRNKQIMLLDLKTADGAAAAWELLEDADVIVENFRPSVMERLGFGRAAVLEKHPQIVYLSLPGYSSDDVDRRDLRAFEGTIMAECGVFSDMGLNRVLMGVNPSYSTLAMASTYSAVLGALSAVLALLGRESSGKGDAVEVPLAAGLCEALVYNSMELPDLPQRYIFLRKKEIQRRRRLGLPMNLSYQNVKALLDPFFHTYTCRDGRSFYVVAVGHAIHQERCLKALGVWDALIQLGLPLGDVWRALACLDPSTSGLWRSTSGLRASPAHMSGLRRSSSSAAPARGLAPVNHQLMRSGPARSQATRTSGRGAVSSGRSR